MSLPKTTVFPSSVFTADGGEGNLKSVTNNKKNQTKTSKKKMKNIYIFFF